MSNCALKFKCMIVKSLMIEDKRVGEEAKVECGVLFIRHGEAELPFGYYIVYLDIL